MVDLLLNHHGYSVEYVTARELEQEILKVLKGKDVTTTVKEINEEYYVIVSSDKNTIHVRTNGVDVEFHEPNAEYSSYFDRRDEALMEVWRMM